MRCWTLTKSESFGKLAQVNFWHYSLKWSLHDNSTRFNEILLLSYCQLCVFPFPWYFTLWWSYCWHQRCLYSDSLSLRTAYFLVCNWNDWKANELLFLLWHELRVTSKLLVKSFLYWSHFSLFPWRDVTQRSMIFALSLPSKFSNSNGCQ